MRHIDLATKVKFYFDEHSPRSVEKGLLKRGFDVGMTQKDDDSEHLPYAAERGLVVFTRDQPFAGRTAKHTNHAGLVCWTGDDDNFGGMIRKLIDFAEQHSAEEVSGRVFWLK